MKDARVAYRKIQAEVVSLALAGKRDDATSLLLTKFRDVQKTYFDGVSGLIGYQTSLIEYESKAAASAYVASFRINTILAILSVLMALALAFFVAKSIIKPIDQCVDIADQVAQGNTDVSIAVLSNNETGKLLASMKTMVEKVKLLVTDAGMLSEAAIEGKLATRADASKHGGDFQKVVQGVNDTLDTLVGLIDCMPAPAMIIDRDFNVLYINEIGATVGGRKAKELIGTKCYDHFKTSDCKTQNCACSQSMISGTQVKAETDAHPGALNLEISYTAVPVKDKNGVIIGAFEVVTDQTEVKAAMKKAEKVAKYQSQETTKLVDGLEKFAKGDLNFSLDVAAGDDDTEGVKEVFSTIVGVVGQATDAVRRLIVDANMLSEAAIEGKLATRADAMNHQGDFRKIIQGVNTTLDSVIGPLNVAAKYVDKISKGEIPQIITDSYNGDFNEIKNNINILVEKLTEVIEGIIAAADNVASGSQQMSPADVSGRDGAGGICRRGILLHGADGIKYQTERRQCAADGKNCPQGGPGRERRWQGSGGDGRRHEGDCHEDHHRRRDRPADKPPCLECRYRGSEGGRTRQGFCGRRVRSKETCGKKSDCGSRNKQAFHIQRKHSGNGGRDAQ
jgi:methyl-accepting chemotaxis protein